jgi:hypothetical protein
LNTHTLSQQEWREGYYLQFEVYGVGGLRL